jgi:flagellar biosynthetic protein FliR
MDGLGSLLPLLPAWLLHVVRALAFVAAVPLLGTQADSRMLRLVLAVALASILFWSAPRAVAPPANLVELGLCTVREALVGLLAGFAVSQLTAALAIAGEVISNEMGFGMAEIVNPETGRVSPVVVQLLEVFGVLLVFALDLHHGLLQVLAAAYAALPVGQAFDFGVVFGRIQELLALGLLGGIQYALPVLGVMLLSTATLVMLARALPTINLLEFSFGARILLALLASVYFLGEGIGFLRGLFETVLARAGLLFAGA